MMDHETLRENLPAYALGVLDAEETGALKAHLATCDTCPRELAEYQAAATPLLSVQARAPRSGLRRDLVARIRPRSRAASAPRRWSFGPALTAAALAAVLLLSGVSFMQTRALNAKLAELSAELAAGQTALGLVASPGTHTVSSEDQVATGSLMMNASTKAAVLVLTGLPELQAGQTYQIWLVAPDGSRVSGGLFEPAPGDTVTVASVGHAESIYDYNGVGVTVEPECGSEWPTGQRVFLVEY